LLWKSARSRWWAPALVLALAAAIRLAVALAYTPGLFYFDSWLYLGMTRAHPVLFAPDRPSGYPLLLKLSLSATGTVAAVPVLQHLAGLLTGLLVYVLVRRLGVPRWIAVTAMALVALDGYTIALEQHILPEALFSLALVASVAALLLAGPRWRIALLSGALLACAILLRTAGLFAVPVWLAFLLFGPPSAARGRAAGVAALALPLILYMSLHALATGQFALSESDGWFLYGRVASIGGCGQIAVPRAASLVCREPQLKGAQDPSEYVYSPYSPARIAFGPLSGDSSRVVAANAALREYAFAAIEQRPGAYLRLVGSDFLRFFEPGASSPGREDLTLELPPADLLLYWDDPPLRRDLLPSYRPVLKGSVLARAYVDRVRLPGWLLGALLLASLVRLAVALRSRTPQSRRTAGAILLLAGVALAILLGSVASTAFRLRYLTPVAPLLVCAGALALSPTAPSPGSGRRRLSA